MFKTSVLFITFVIVYLVEAKIYFKEQFNDEQWHERWVESVYPGKEPEDMGKWVWTTGKWFGGSKDDKGIQTSENSKHYGLSAKLDEPLTNYGKDLIIQFTAKNEQRIECGGAYIKLLGPNFDQKTFNDKTPYQIMFGPDFCGLKIRKTHVIFYYPPKNQTLEMNRDIKAEFNQLSHLYTLHIKPDNTFQVLIDGEEKRSSKLQFEFKFLESKEIRDPSVKKPADWVKEKLIPDPTDTKPADWDDIPKLIPDSNAKKPDYWIDEEDGEWAPPMIPNPNYQGEWKPRMIQNPNYKGEWVHPMIPNPKYVADDKLHLRCQSCTHIGFELWQVTAGTIFDDIIITDSIDEANAFANETFFKKRNLEQEMYDEVEKKGKTRKNSNKKDSKDEL